MSPNKYNVALYVHRSQFFKELWEWFSSSSPEYRLRSLVGPIGIGKSWFMSHVYNKMKNDPDYLPIWLDLSKKAMYPDNSLSGNFPDVAGGGNGRTQWLREIINQINATCSLHIIFDPSVSFPAMFSHIIANLCQHCGEITPILLVDGYDEVALEEDRKYLQEHIFANFWEPSCTRVLIARRDIQELPHHILSWNEETISLSGFNDKQQQHQIKKHLASPVSHSNLSQYLTENPYINSLLIEFAAKKHPASLELAELRNCVDIITASIDIVSTDTIKRIAIDLPPTWTSLALRKKMGIVIDDPRLRPLFEAGVIHHVTGTARYQIEAGFYSLLQKTKTETQNV